MPLRVLSSVHVESIQIAQYYAQQQTGLAERFFDSLDQAFQQIEANPLGHPRLESVVTDRNIRRIVMDHFSYLVLFEILADEAVVFAVRHASRQPGINMTHEHPE